MLAEQFQKQKKDMYAITEMETLAIVWTMCYFRHYLYGHNVTLFTDHSAVKAVLNNPGGNGKYAQWWTKVYGNGVKMWI